MSEALEALEAAAAELPERIEELKTAAEVARVAWTDSKGAAGTFDTWTAAIKHLCNAESALAYLKAVIEQLEAEAAAPEVRIPYLSQFDDYALEAMVSGGKWNDFTGKLETATRAEVDAVYAYRAEREANWAAEHSANEVVGDQNSDNAIFAADTVSTPVYSLMVNGKKSEHATFVNRWGLAYGVARELLALGIDPEDNTGFIAAVLSTIDDGSSVISGDLETGSEFSIVFEENN